MIPMPPSRATAMANRASVTVSMAALTMGMLFLMWRSTLPPGVVASPLYLEVRGAVRLLDSVLAGVRHVHEAVPIDGDPPRIPELAGFLPLRPPLHEKLREEVRAGVKLLDPMVAHVHDVHRPVA